MMAAKVGVPKPKTKAQNWVDQRPASSQPAKQTAANPVGSNLDAIYAQLREL